MSRKRYRVFDYLSMGLYFVIVMSGILVLTRIFKPSFNLWVLIPVYIWVLLPICPLIKIQSILFRKYINTQKPPLISVAAVITELKIVDRIYPSKRRGKW